MVPLFKHSQCCWGSGSSQGHRACYLRSVLFSQVPDSEYRQALNAVSTRSSNAVWVSSLPLIPADSFHQHGSHWEATGYAMGWEIRLLLIPCTWNKTARLNSHQKQEMGEREGQLLQIRAENAGCCSFPDLIFTAIYTSLPSSCSLPGHATAEHRLPWSEKQVIKSLL